MNSHDFFTSKLFFVVSIVLYSGFFLSCLLQLKTRKLSLLCYLTYRLEEKRDFCISKRYMCGNKHNKIDWIWTRLAYSTSCYNNRFISHTSILEFIVLMPTRKLLRHLNFLSVYSFLLSVSFPTLSTFFVFYSCRHRKYPVVIWPAIKFRRLHHKRLLSIPCPQLLPNPRLLSLWPSSIRSTFTLITKFIHDSSHCLRGLKTMLSLASACFVPFSAPRPANGEWQLFRSRRIYRKNVNKIINWISRDKK